MKKISLQKRTEYKSQQGFSLIELLIVTVVLLIVLGILATIVGGVQSAYTTHRERAAKHTEALASLNLITRIVRNAGSNTTQTALTATGNDRLRIKSDWNISDDSLDDPFEDVEFYVSDNVLYMTSVSPITNTVELAQNIESINFEYFDSNGATTTNMASVVRVRFNVTIAGDSESLVSEVGVRKMIQPR